MEASHSQQRTSPHVLDLSSKLASLEQDVTGKLEEVRGTVGTVLQGADIAIPQKTTELAGERIHAGVRSADPAPSAPAAPSFQPYERTYARRVTLVRTPQEERATIRWERENELRFRTNPGALLRDRTGAPDAALTAERYAEAIERGAQL